MVFFFFQIVSMVDYLNRFSYFEAALHLRDESYCAIVNCRSLLQQSQLGFLDQGNINTEEMSDERNGEELEGLFCHVKIAKQPRVCFRVCCYLD